MSCAECGASLPARARFCSECGAPVAGTGNGDGVEQDQDADLETTTVVRDEREQSRGEDPTLSTEGGPAGAEGAGRAEADRTSVIGDTDPDLDPITADDGDLATCPSCGATNSARRMLCGRCGADLETGQPGRPPQARPTGDRPAAPDGDADDGGRSVPTGLLVVVGAVLAGVAIGFGLLLTGVIGGGGDGGDPLPEPPAFSSPASPLGVQRVVASSAGGAAAGPALVADRDLSTAWRAADGQTVGQAMRLELGRSVWVEELLVAVGDQGAESFTSTARPTRLRVAFGEQDTVIIELADQPGVQRVSLDPARRTDVIRIEVLEVAGETAGPVALTEVVVRGHPAGS